MRISDWSSDVCSSDLSVKDLYGVKGFPTFAGSPKRLPASWEAEGPVVAALRSGMAVVPGKTHTVEFAFGGIGTNPHWGTPRNPWGASGHRVPGGSSAGAGVSLWEGSCMIALDRKSTRLNSSH